MNNLCNNSKVDPVKINRANRRGAAAVEFALVSPLLFLFVFASFEFSRANMVRNHCDNAAFSAAREGVLPGASQQKCIDVAEASLEILNIRNAEINVEPAVIDPSTPEVTVEIKIPMINNAMPMSRFVVGTTMTRSMTVKRETFGAATDSQGSDSQGTGSQGSGSQPTENLNSIPFYERFYFSKEPRVGF
jgi:hypothetical protein